MKKSSDVSPRKSRLQKAGEMWHFLATQDAFRTAPVLTLFRSATWLLRCLLRLPTTLYFPTWYVRMFFPSERKGFGKFIFAFRERYEPELGYLEKILLPGDVFIDAGANFGVYTLVASKLVGDTGKVLAFEPAAQSFATLQKNINLNNFSNVRSFQIALAQTRSKAWLNYGWDPMGNWLSADPSCGNEGEEIQTEALDELIEQNGISRVAAIKIDVEGAEELVLRGAKGCLTSQSPIVIFEFNPSCATRIGLSPWGARDLLASLGYEFIVLDDWAISTNPSSQPTYFNIIAIPKRSAEELPRSLHFIGDREFRKGKSYETPFACAEPS